MPWSPTVTRGPRPVPRWSLPGSWGRGGPGAGWQDGRHGSERVEGTAGLGSGLGSPVACAVDNLAALTRGKFDVVSGLEPGAAASSWRRASHCWRSPDFLGLSGMRGPTPPAGKGRVGRDSLGHTCSASHNLCSGTFEE